MVRVFLCIWPSSNYKDTTLEEESQAKEGSDEESSVEDSGHMVYVADQVMTWEEAPKRLATFEDSIGQAWPFF